jgi:hypothetical protein
MRAKSYLCRSALVQKSSAELHSGLVTEWGEAASVCPRGCATKRPVGDNSEGVTSAQNAVRASRPWAKHESLPREAPDQAHAVTLVGIRVSGDAIWEQRHVAVTGEVPRSPGLGRVKRAYKSVTKWLVDAAARIGFSQPHPLGDGSRVGVGIKD